MCSHNVPDQHPQIRTHNSIAVMCSCVADRQGVPLLLFARAPAADAQRGAEGGRRASVRRSMSAHERAAARRQAGLQRATRCSIQGCDTCFCFHLCSCCSIAASTCCCIYLLLLLYLLHLLYCFDMPLPFWAVEKALNNFPNFKFFNLISIAMKEIFENLLR